MARLFVQVAQGSEIGFCWLPICGVLCGSGKAWRFSHAAAWIEQCVGLLNAASAGRFLPCVPPWGSLLLGPVGPPRCSGTGTIIRALCFSPEVWYMQELLLHCIVLVCTSDKCSHVCACFHDYDADPAGLLREQSLLCCSPTDYKSLGHLVSYSLTRCSRVAAARWHVGPCCDENRLLLLLLWCNKSFLHGILDEKVAVSVEMLKGLQARQLGCLCL